MRILLQRDRFAMMPATSYWLDGAPVVLRLSEEQRERIEARAAGAGLSVSAYLAAVDGGRAAGEAEAIGMSRAELVRALALGMGPGAVSALRRAVRRAESVTGAPPEEERKR